MWLQSSQIGPAEEKASPFFRGEDNVYDTFNASIAESEKETFENSIQQSYRYCWRKL